MRTKSLNALFIRSPKLNQLWILNELASDSHLTQAELARRCDLSVAMVNNYMKELCGMGMLEYRRKSSKSVSYHLTPEGGSLASSLERDLVRELVDLFVQAKERVRNLVAVKAPGTLRRVVLYGSGNLAELAFHALESAGTSVIGICRSYPSEVRPVWWGTTLIDPSEVGPLAPDAVIVVSDDPSDDVHRKLSPIDELGIQLIRLDGSSEAEPMLQNPAPQDAAAELEHA